LKSKSGYKVYASIWHVPFPACKVKSEIIAVIDSKGRLVGEFGEGLTIHDYVGKYTMKVGREAVAGYLNGEWEENIFTGDEVVLTSMRQVEKRASLAPPGGFHIFVAGEHVPRERSFSVKAIYTKFLLESSQVAVPDMDDDVLEMVRTDGRHGGEALVESLIKYLGMKYHWHLEPEEVHLISDTELESMRSNARDEGCETYIPAE
jgi:hypothetical protein